MTNTNLFEIGIDRIMMTIIVRGSCSTD